MSMQILDTDFGTVQTRWIDESMDGVKVTTNVFGSVSGPNGATVSIEAAGCRPRRNLWRGVRLASARAGIHFHQQVQMTTTEEFQAVFTDVRDLDGGHHFSHLLIV